MGNTAGRIIELIQSKAAAGKIKAGVFADINNMSGSRIMLNENTRFPIASAFKIALLLDIAARVRNGHITVTDKLELHDYHKVPGSGLLDFPDGTGLSIDFLLTKVFTRSDNGAADILGGFLGWGSIPRSLSRISPLLMPYIMPAKLMMLVECNLWAEFRNKPVEEQIRLWNGADPGVKMELILNNYQKLKHLSPAEIQAASDAYDPQLTIVGRKLLVQNIGWRGAPGKWGELISNIANDGLFAAPGGDFIRNYLKLGGRGLLWDSISARDLVECGRKGGSHEGIRCDMGYAKFRSGKTVSLVIMAQEQTPIEDRLDEMEDFIKDVSRLVLRHYEIS